MADYQEKGDQLQDIEDEEGQEQLDQMNGDNPIQIQTPEGYETPEGEGDSSYSLGAQKDMVGKFMGDLVERENWRRAYEILWWQIYVAYMSGNVATRTPTRSKVFIPLIFQIIEVATPKLISFTSGNENLFDVVANDINEADTAKSIKRLLSDQFDKTEFDDKYETFLKQLLMYGTSYFWVDWDVEWQWKVNRVPKVNKYVDDNGVNQEKTVYETKKRYEIVGRRPNLTVLDVLDVFPSQDHAEVANQPSVMIRKFIVREEFARICDSPQPYFGNKDAAMASGTSSKYQETRQWRKTARGEISTVSSKDIELIEVWGYWDLDGDGKAEPCQIVIANRQIVVRAVPNPFDHQEIPLVKVNFCKVPFEWYGIGLVEPVLTLQSETNLVRRQRLDNVNILINQMYKVLSTDTSIDVDKVAASPSGVILVDAMENLQSIERKDVTTNAYQDAQAIQQDMFNATVPASLTGNIDDMQGNNKGIGMGVAKVAVAQGLEKFATAAKAIETKGIKNVLRLFYMLDLQYLTNSEVVRAFYGHLFPQPAIVSPAMIRTAAGVNFKMTVLSEMVNRDQKVNQMSTFFTLAQQQLAPESIDTILKQIWELMGFDSKDIRAAALNAQPAAGAAGAPNPMGGTAPIPGNPAIPPANAPAMAGATPPPLGIPPTPGAAAGKQILAAHNASAPAGPAASIVPQLNSGVGHVNIPGAPSMPIGAR
jgi:hypothetical protein